MNSSMLAEPAGVTTSPYFQQKCATCSGHMNRVICTDIQSDNVGINFWAFRCVQCGDIIDEVILRNRSRTVVSRPTPTMLAVEAAA